MTVADFVAESFVRLRPRRRRVALCAALLVVVSALGASRIRMEENIAAMLPDRGSNVARDFELLQRAPFARRAVINLEAQASAATELVTTADRLAAALDPQLFGAVASGPDPVLQTRLLPWLGGALPALLGERELEQLVTDLEQGGVKRRLEESYAALLAPQGWAMKSLIRRDPLGLYRSGLEKLRYLNLVPGMHLVDGHFVSADGRNALLLAEPPAAITDSAAARALEAEFSRAVAASVPPGVSATLVSGHRYTLANAEAIRADLGVLLVASSLAILALFAIFLRSLRALFVFLLPVAVVCLAALAVAALFPTVSAITIGFGAVLLGMTIDFGLHVYFALRHGESRAETRLHGVVKPVLFGGLTTVAAFAVLLGSDLPGQRQLAVFSMVGIGVALLLALLVLPQLVPVDVAPALGHREARRRPPGAAWRIAAWLLVLVLSAWLTTGVSFDGDLRRMSLEPPHLAAAEAHLRQTWGDFRGLAMFWSAGASREETLELNNRLFELLRERYPDETPVSLAPLLPPRALQEANIARWQAFWEGTRGARLLEQLRAEAARLGFNAKAFAPFFAALHDAPAVQDLESLNVAGLAELGKALVGEDGSMLTLAPDHAELPALIREAFAGRVHAVSPGGFRAELSAAIDHDFRSFITAALVAVGVLLVILFRRPLPVLAAAVPVVTGLLVMFGVMGGLGISFNLFNVVATILVIGLGIDYGIFMVCRLRDGLDRATDRAVLVSGLTTLAGFGALVLARHPALHSIGVSVLLGIGAALPAALWVIPALFPREGA